MPTGSMTRYRLAESRSSQSIKVGILALSLSLLGGVPQVLGFELVTHAALTREAFLESMLNPGTPTQPRPTDLLKRLGLEVRDADLGTVYFDIGLSNSNLRSAFPRRFESFAIGKIDEANLVASFTPQIPSLPAWLMLGAVREDDVPHDPGELENSPDDDPQGSFVRVMHHFYDPFHDAPLTIDDIVPGTRARDWATRGSAGRDGRREQFQRLEGTRGDVACTYA